MELPEAKPLVMLWWNTSLSPLGESRATPVDKAYVAAYLTELRRTFNFTDGKVEICRQEYEKQHPNFFGIATALFAPKEKYWAIAARNPKAEDNKLRQIALWEQGRSGYPCKISWGGMDRTCHDRESLEGCLASLLGDAVVGEKLRGVMMLPPPQETGEGAAIDPA